MMSGGTSGAVYGYKGFSEMRGLSSATSRGGEWRHQARHSIEGRQGTILFQTERSPSQYVKEVMPRKDEGREKTRVQAAS